MREIFIERRDKLIRIGIKDKGKLVECYIEEECNEARPGQIYKGIIKNIVPAIKCAFIDIGYNKNAYLHLDNKTGAQRFKKGDEVIVEVIKEEIGTKGAKVTSAISLAGRYCALITQNTDVNFSSKILNADFKRNLRKLISKPKQVGIMIRTNAQGVDSEAINKEFSKLYHIYENIKAESTFSQKPHLLYSDEGVLDSVLRDSFNKDTVKVIVDNEKDFLHIKDYIDKMRDINTIPEFYEEHRTLFDFYGIEREILSLRNNIVNLSCGGYIVIERTEAMYVIDVNSGKSISSTSIEKTAFLTNLQAAEEIATQIKLRNLSGIILVDFIDMVNAENKKQVISRLQDGFVGDKNKIVVYPFTELNLVQISRRRRGKDIHEFMEDPCKECKGRGEKLKANYLYILIKNEVLRVDSDDRIKDIYIEINEEYMDVIKSDLLCFIKEIGGINKQVYLNFTDMVEYFKIEPLIFMSQIQNVERFKISL